MRLNSSSFSQSPSLISPVNPSLKKEQKKNADGLLFLLKAAVIRKLRWSITGKKHCEASSEVHKNAQLEKHSDGSTHTCWVCCEPGRGGCLLFKIYFTLIIAAPDSLTNARKSSADRFKWFVQSDQEVNQSVTHAANFCEWPSLMGTSSLAKGPLLGCVNTQRQTVSKLSNVSPSDDLRGVQQRDAAL